ncbi:MAG: HU family DNA-binding protein [Acidobacteriota bacterium]
MNKGELIERVSQDAEISKAQADRAINAVLSGITDSLRRGGHVTLVGFGSFKIAARRARAGLNPRTKEPIKIPAKKAVRFSAGAKLRAAVNKAATKKR